MGVASCRSTFLCLMLSVRLVPFRISIRDLNSFSGRARRGFFDPRSGPAQPSPAQPSRPGPPRPARPWRPNPPMRPPPLSLSHLDLPRNNLSSPSSTSLSPWCPRIWRRRSPDFGPRGELPSPPLLLSLSLSLLFFSPRAAPFSPCPRATPTPAALARGGAAPARLPSARRRGPCPPLPAAALGLAPCRPGPLRAAPPLGSAGRGGPAPSRGAASPARPRAPALGRFNRPPGRFNRPSPSSPARSPSRPRPTVSSLARARGDYSLISVLRRALRRATDLSKFRFYLVLRRALRRATIHFCFRLFKV